jgi:antirestriction protein ArdC
VFNAEQVEGYQPKVVEVSKLVERSERVTEFLRHMLVNYREGSDSAY